MTWTRRDFLKQSAAGFAAGMLPSALTASPFRVRAEFRELRRNVGIYTNRGGTVGWINTLDGAAVIDSQFPDTAELLLVELRDIGARPLHALINTHHHADHTGGNKNLRYVSRAIVAHEKAKSNQERVAREGGTEAAQAYPDTTFADTWNFTLGNEKISAKYYGPAHTGGDIAITFENANIVHLGDLVNNRGFPNIDAVAGGSVHGWIRVLDQLAADHTSDTLYIFGHSEGGKPVTGAAADLMYQKDYFAAVIEVAARAIRQGQTRDQAIRLTTLPGFADVAGTASRLGLAVGVAYDELKAGASR